MAWEQIVDKVAQFWNAPVPIICVSVGSVVIGIIAIISKTSFGRKKYLEFKQWKEETTSQLLDFVQNKKAQVEEIKAEYEKKIEEVKTDFENKLALVDNENQVLKNAIIYLGENINNQNIKAYIVDFKAKIESCAQDISEVVAEVVENVKKDYEEKQQELENRLKELEEKVNNGRENTETEEKEI